MNNSTQDTRGVTQIQDTPVIREVQPLTAWESHLIYREMEEVPVQSLDLLERFSKSLDEVEDLHGRVRFVMKEVRELMKA